MIFKTDRQTNRRLADTREQARKIVCSSVSCVLTILLALSSCGGDSQTFKIEGKLKNIDQGEFYLYSIFPGDMQGIDTIRVDRGRFARKIPCQEPQILSLVFPNHSEQPIFAEPGRKVEIEGDASSLKDLETKGTKDNELLTAFRKKTTHLPPKEVKTAAEEFIGKYPESMTSVYLVQKYFLQGKDYSYKKAEQLLTGLASKQQDNTILKQLLNRVRKVKNSEEGSPIPTFKGKDIKGANHTDAELKNADVAVVTTCATWDFDSMSLLRRLRRLQKSSRGRLKLITILLDGNKQECQRIAESDTISWPILFDDRYFESSLMKQFGLSYVGDNIIYKGGRVAAHSIPKDKFPDEVKKCLE